jgi:histone deacetylase complex subunit SAP18
MLSRSPLSLLLSSRPFPRSPTVTPALTILSRKDSTLRELTTALRNTSPTTPEYRHPLARFSFRAVYADPTNKGRFAQKDLGMVYSRDILGEPGSMDATAPRLLADHETNTGRRSIGGGGGGDGDGDDAAAAAGGGGGEGAEGREERTLDELKFVSGDYMLIAVLFPKSVNIPSAATEPKAPVAPGWKSMGRDRERDSGWGGAVNSGLSGPPGRGGGHWRGGSDGPPSFRGGRGGGRGGGGGVGRGDRDRDRDRERDRSGERDDKRVPPPRRDRDRDSPPPPRRGGWGRGRGGGRKSKSRSRSPPRRERRGSKYDD